MKSGIISSLKKYSLSQDSDWDTLINEIPFLTNWGCMTLRDGLIDIAKVVLVEPFYICKDYRNLYSYFYSKKFKQRDIYCHRLHFFSNESINISDLFDNLSEAQKHYLG